MTELTKRFVVDRSKWRRGGRTNEETHGETSLLNSRGFMCCLGFVCIQQGLSEEDIRLEGEPCSLSEYSEEIDDAIGGLLLNNDEEDGMVNSDLAQKAIDINDNESVTDAEREAALSSLFEKNGCEMVFVDGETAS